MVGSAASVAAAAESPVTVKLDGRPQVGALANGALWIVEARDGGAALVEIDSAAARPTGREVPLPIAATPNPFGVGGRSFLGPQRVRPSLAVAGGDLFVPAGDEVLQIDPVEGREVRRIPFAARYVASGPAGLWALGGSEFVLGADGRVVGVRWQLAGIDPETGAIQEIFIGPGLDGLAPVELAVTEADLWVVFPAVERRLVRVDPSTGALRRMGRGNGSWLINATDDTLYGAPRYGDVIVARRGEAASSFDMGLRSGAAVYWRDLAAGPADSLWAATFRGQGQPGLLHQRPLTGDGPVQGYTVGTDPVDVVPAPQAVWVLNAADETLTKVPAARPATAPTGQVRLTAAQLRINQRISQAAVRRLNALTAVADGVAPPRQEPRKTAGRVTLSARQLLINQRISQAAVRRANDLAGRLEGRLAADGPPARSGDRVTLSARQLLIGQRIAQAAVRRANALAERIPEIPFPAPGPLSAELDHVLGVMPEGTRSVMHVDTIRRRGTLGDGSQLAVSDSLPVVLPSHVPKATDYGDGSLMAAIGVIYKGVMFGRNVSITFREYLDD